LHLCTSLAKLAKLTKLAKLGELGAKGWRKSRTAREAPKRRRRSAGGARPERPSATSCPEMQPKMQPKMQQRCQLCIFIPRGRSLGLAQLARLLPIGRTANGSPNSHAHCRPSLARCISPLAASRRLSVQRPPLNTQGPLPAAESSHLRVQLARLGAHLRARRAN